MVVDHHRVGRSVTKHEELFERRADRGNVGLDRVVRQHLADFVLARRVADPCRATTHQNDRFMARLLQTAQEHDRDQIADVQRGRGRIEPDIAGHDLRRGQLVQRLAIGDLVNVAAV